MKAFNTKVPKGVFPFRVTMRVEEYLEEHHHLLEWKDNVIEILKHSKIPDKSWFYNDLKGQEVNDQVYNDILSKYDNLYVLLEQYNNQDVSPSRDATKKLAEFFREIKLDIHKDGLSISGLSLKYLWSVKDTGSEFELFKGNEDVGWKSSKDSTISRTNGELFLSLWLKLLLESHNSLGNLYIKR